MSRRDAGRTPGTSRRPFAAAADRDALAVAAARGACLASWWRRRALERRAGAAVEPTALLELHEDRVELGARPGLVRRLGWALAAAGDVREEHAVGVLEALALVAGR